MMENDDIFEKVKAFTIQKTLDYKTEITEFTDLQKDLGIYGDDATEFLLSFGKEFNVDLSVFPADKYFKSEEGEIPFLHLFKRLFNFKNDEETYLPLTIRDLIEAVKSGEMK